MSAGCRQLVIDAFKLAGSLEFCRLENAVALRLEQGRVLDQCALSFVKAIVEGTMQYKTLEVAFSSQAPSIWKRANARVKCGGR